jgi:hypothetical protein
VLALAGLPTSATAQVDQETAPGDKVHLALIPEHLQERQPGYSREHHPAPISPDDDPAPELNPHEKKVQNAKIGIGVSGGLLLIGGIMAGAGGAASIDFDLDGSPSGDSPALYVGAAIAGAGAISLIATGILLGVRKRKLREHQEAHRLGSHRMQWDAARSRLVF